MWDRVHGKCIVFGTESTGKKLTVPRKGTKCERTEDSMGQTAGYMCKVYRTECTKRVGGIRDKVHETCRYRHT